MAGRTHRYAVEVEWTGNTGTGTRRYDGYKRDHLIRANGKEMAGSSDPAFRGDPGRWNPEELLVASASACHKLWWLHLCSANGIVVETYLDRAEGEMVEDGDGGGRFTKITLRPAATISAGDAELAARLHHEAHEKCFVANSLSCPVEIEPTVTPA